MGHFIGKEVDRLDKIVLSSLDEGEWIDIKRKMSLGSYEQIAKAGKTDEERIVATLMENIVAWNLSNGAGIVELTTGVLSSLDPNLAIELFAEIGERNKLNQKKA